MFTVTNSGLVNRLFRWIIAAVTCCIWSSCFGDESAARPPIASTVKFTPLSNTLYRSKLGNNEDTVCLKINTKGELDGSYYENKSKKVRVLHRAEPSTVTPSPPVLELAPMYLNLWDNVWLFTELTADVIRGTRRTHGKEIEMNFDMKKIGTVADCNKALFASLHLDQHVIQQLDIGPVQFVNYGDLNKSISNDSDNDGNAGVAGLRIDRGIGESARQKINTILRSKLDNENNHRLYCDYLGYTQTILMLSKTHLTIRENENGYCNATHAFNNSFVLNFNLLTGDLVNMHKLIDWKAFIKSTHKGQLKQELTDIQDWRDECLDYFNQTGWDHESFGDHDSFWLTNKNVIFVATTSTPDHLMCNGDFPISFKAFRRVLRAQARSLYDRYVTDVQKNGVMIGKLRDPQ